MANSQNYLPPRDADFDGWLENLTNYVTGKTGGQSPAWTHIPAAKVSALTARYTAWEIQSAVVA